MNKTNNLTQIKRNENEWSNQTQSQRERKLFN